MFFITVTLCYTHQPDITISFQGALELITKGQVAFWAIALDFI